MHIGCLPVAGEGVARGGQGGPGMATVAQAWQPGVNAQASCTLGACLWLGKGWPWGATVPDTSQASVTSLAGGWPLVGQGWPGVATVTQAWQPGVSGQPHAHWVLACGWGRGGHGWPQSLTQARHQWPAWLEAGLWLGRGGQGWPQWLRHGSQESVASLMHIGCLPVAGEGVARGGQGGPGVATVAQAWEPG